MANKSNKDAHAKASSAGIRERELESSKKEDLRIVPENTRNNEIMESIKKNNIQSRYHAK